MEIDMQGKLIKYVFKRNVVMRCKFSHTGFVTHIDLFLYKKENHIRKSNFKPLTESEINYLQRT